MQQNKIKNKEYNKKNRNNVFSLLRKAADVGRVCVCVCALTYHLRLECECWMLEVEVRRVVSSLCAEGFI